MVVTKGIPAVIKISNIRISFRYRRQPPFCFVCEEVGHAGKDCPKSQKARKNTPNADLRPDNLRHKIHNVKEGDLRVKFNNSKQVRQVPHGGSTTASSSPPSSAIKADHIPTSRTSNNSNTHMPNNNTNDMPHTHNNSNNNTPNSNAQHMPNSTDQPVHTINPVTTSSSSSLSPTLSDTISELKKVFKMWMTGWIARLHPSVNQPPRLLVNHRKLSAIPSVP